MSVVRIRGLPYSARADDIIDFFKGDSYQTNKYLLDVKIKGGKRGIYFPQGPNGRSNGEAFIELEDSSEMDRATAHHNEHIGRRYIEVFPSSRHELDSAMGRNSRDPYRRKEFVVRLRGLPYDTEKKEIYAFFNGLEIAPNGIGLLVDHMGRCTGEAYVQFTSAEMLARAKEKHMEKIGHRYIEIFESTMVEANMTIQRQMEANQGRSGGGVGGPMFGRPSRDGYPGPGYYGSPKGGYGTPMGPGYNRGPPPGRFTPYARPPHPAGPPGYDSPPRSAGPMNMIGSAAKSPMFGSGSNPDMDDPQSMTGHSIRMRGLPFSATSEDIDKFLSPLQPVNIRILLNPAGRPTGEAIVDFASHDEAKEAMKKDREKIGSRYIELFLASTPAGIGARMSSGHGPAYGSAHRNHGPPGSPPYSNGGSRRPTMSYMGDMRPYGHNDYGGMRDRDEMAYGSGPAGGRDFDEPDYYYNGRMSGPSMGPGGDNYGDYRPYRQGNYNWL